MVIVLEDSLNYDEVLSVMQWTIRGIYSETQDVVNK